MTILLFWFTGVNILLPQFHFIRFSKFFIQNKESIIVLPLIIMFLFDYLN